MAGEGRTTVPVGALSDLADELRAGDAHHVERQGRQRVAWGPVELGEELEAAEAEVGVPPIELAADARSEGARSERRAAASSPVIRPKATPLPLSLAIRAEAPRRAP